MLGYISASVYWFLKTLSSLIFLLYVVGGSIEQIMSTEPESLGILESTLSHLTFPNYTPNPFQLLSSAVISSSFHLNNLNNLLEENQTMLKSPNLQIA